MIQNIKESLKNYFETEKDFASNLDFDKGYSERDINWMKSNLIPRIKNLASENMSKSCLDVGCAYGYFTKVLSESFDQTYGVDLSTNRIEYAKKYETNSIKFVQSDLTESFASKFPVKFDFGLFQSHRCTCMPFRYFQDGLWHIHAPKQRQIFFAIQLIMSIYLRTRVRLWKYE